MQESAHPDANIIFGTVIDDSLGDEVRVTVIAAGFDAAGAGRKPVIGAAGTTAPEKTGAHAIAAAKAGKLELDAVRARRRRRRAGSYQRGSTLNIGGDDDDVDLMPPFMYAAEVGRGSAKWVWGRDLRMHWAREPFAFGE